MFEAERARGADQMITTLIKAVLEAILVELDPATATMSKIQSCSSAEKSSTLHLFATCLGWFSGAAPQPGHLPARGVLALALKELLNTLSPHLDRKSLVGATTLFLRKAMRRTPRDGASAGLSSLGM